MRRSISSLLVVGGCLLAIVLVAIVLWPLLRWPRTRGPDEISLVSQYEEAVYVYLCVDVLKVWSVLYLARWCRLLWLQRTECAGISEAERHLPSIFDSSASLGCWCCNYCIHGIVRSSKALPQIDWRGAYTAALPRNTIVYFVSLNESPIDSLRITKLAVNIIVLWWFKRVFR